MTPTQRVVAWLDAAHAFGSLEAYVESLLDQPAEAFPLNRLTREAAIGARAALRGKPTEIVNAAVRKALRETVFRFDLVMRINVTAHETLERESLVQALIASNVALLMNLEKESEPSYLGRLVACRDAPSPGSTSSSHWPRHVGSSKPATWTAAPRCSLSSPSAGPDASMRGRSSR